MNSLTSNKTRQTQFKIQCAQKLVIKPNHQEIIKCKIEDKKKKFDFLSGVVTPLRKFEKKTGLCLITSLSTVEKGNVVSLSAINVTDHPITVTYGCPIATFEFLSSEQAEKLYPVDPQLIALAKLRNPSNIVGELNMLVLDENFTSNQQPPRPPPEYKKLWFPTPETCDDPSTLNPLQLKIHAESSMGRAN